MSKNIKITVMLGLAVLVAACASQEDEFVAVEPEPISAEPVYTGKYK